MPSCRCKARYTPTGQTVKRATQSCSQPRRSASLLNSAGVVDVQLAWLAAHRPHRVDVQPFQPRPLVHTSRESTVPCTWRRNPGSSVHAGSDIHRGVDACTQLACVAAAMDGALVSPVVGARCGRPATTPNTAQYKSPGAVRRGRAAPRTQHAGRRQWLSSSSWAHNPEVTSSNLVAATVAGSIPASQESVCRSASADRWL